MRIGRIIAVTLGLSASGAVIGSFVGAIVLLVWAILVDRGNVLWFATVGALYGVLLGAILAPIAAWLFLRRVPIGRALAETSIGTALGAFAGMVIGGLTATSLAGGFSGALIGFLVSAVRLWHVTRPAAAGAAAAHNIVD